MGDYKTKFLVTFCNNWIKSNTNYAEISIEYNSECITNVEFSGFSLGLKDLVGVTGILIDDGKIVLALQGASDQLAYVDKNHQVTEYSTFDGIEDIHGIARIGSDLLCVSTGNNRIVNASKNDLYGYNEFAGLGLDVEHVNDICIHEGRVLATKFGKKRIDGLRNGYVFDPLTGQVLLDGLNQPHSVVSYDGRLYVLDSSRGALIEVNPNIGPQTILKISGYARGLCLSDRFILIGRSRTRTKSKKTGKASEQILFTSEAHAQAANLSGVFVYDKTSNLSIFVDTSHATDEVYQIIAIQ